jgi:hypothetical protein
MPVYNPNSSAYILLGEKMSQAQPKTEHELYQEKALLTMCQQLDNISKQNLQVIQELKNIYQAVMVNPQ